MSPSTLLSSPEHMLPLLKALYPHVECALHYSNSYTLLVAVVLSAQCTDKSVNKATTELFQHAHTPQTMVDLGQKQLEDFIQRLGLYRRKALHIIELSKILLEKYGGEVPRDTEDLEALPGVGRKTACVVRNVWFHEPEIPVDTHVLRVARRLGWSMATTPRTMEKDLHQLIPSAWKKDVSLLLIQHGRTMCKAPRPQCHICPLAQGCPFPSSSSSTVSSSTSQSS